MATQSPDEPRRLPLVVFPENRDDTINKDARLVNCYMEKGVAKDEYFIYQRAGLLRYQQPSGGAANGLGTYNWLGDIYSIFGNKLYKNGVAVSGTVDTTNGVYRFSQSLGTPTRMVFGNGVAAYSWDGTTLTQIQTSGATITAGAFVVGATYRILTIGSTDFTLVGASANTIGVVFVATGVGAGSGTATVGSFPSSFVKGWAFLDETTYVMNAQAAIQGSLLNNPTYYDPLNALTAQIEPDGGVALAKQLAYVIAFKQWSTEVFYDAANATGSPLATVQGAKVNYGCVSADSVQEIDGILIWLCTNRSSATQVIMMDNLKAEIISTKPVERLLDTLDTTSIYSFQFKDEGHRFYIITSVVSNLTLVYDLAERVWHQWTDSSGNYFPFISATYNSARQHIWQHATNGRLYFADRNYANDDGIAIMADIYTPNYDAGTHKRKTLDRMDFIGDKIPGSIIKVRHSDDDYASWSNWREVDMGMTTPFLARCGTFRRRAWNLRHTSNTSSRLSAVELALRIGTL